MKNYLKVGLLVLAVSLYSCGGSNSNSSDSSTESSATANPNANPNAATNPNASANPNSTSASSSTEETAKTEDADAIIDLENKGVGPVKSVTIADKIDMDMAAKGKVLYDAKCETCHRPHKRLVGPPQAGILKRRTPEWTMNMILNPTQMLKEDPLAQKLLAEFGSPMTDMNLTQDQARQVLEYIRTFDKKDLFDQLNK